MFGCMDCIWYNSRTTLEKWRYQVIPYNLFTRVKVYGIWNYVSIFRVAHICMQPLLSMKRKKTGIGLPEREEFSSQDVQERLFLYTHLPAPPPQVIINLVGNIDCNSSNLYFPDYWLKIFTHVYWNFEFLFSLAMIFPDSCPFFNFCWPFS